MNCTDDHRSTETETIETTETETIETIETDDAERRHFSDDDEHEQDLESDMHPHILINGQRYYAIPGFDGYFISRDGRVYFQRRNRELVLHDNGRGYFKVSINGKLCYVHRIMWETFRGPIPPGMTINHVNCNPSDNRLENLELVSQRENNNKKSCHENIRELPDGAVELSDVEYRTPFNVYHFHDLHYYDHCVFERFDTCYRVIRPCSQGHAKVNSIKVQLHKLIHLIERLINQQPE